MISHGKEIKVFAGNSNPKLAEGICKKLNIELGKSVATAFSDGEISISINEPVRGSQLFQFRLAVSAFARMAALQIGNAKSVEARW